MEAGKTKSSDLIESIRRMNWLVNRIHRKTKIPKAKIQEVLFVISDLTFEWQHSKYDFYGVRIEETLHDIGLMREKLARVEKKDW